MFELIERGENQLLQRRFSKRLNHIQVPAPAPIAVRCNWTKTSFLGRIKKWLSGEGEVKPVKKRQKKNQN